MLEPFDLPRDGGVLFLHGGKTLVGDEANVVPELCEPPVGVVLPQEQAVFAAARHDAVGLVRTLGHKIVDECADVALRAGENKGRLPREPARGVHAGNKALYGGLLVTGRAVELPRAVQPRDGFRFQRRLERGGVDAVVLNGVGGAHDLRVLKPRNGMDHPHLYVLGHRGGKALNVQLLGIKPHRFDEELVAGLVREADDLRLDARAVARPDALDHAGVDGAAVEIFADDAVCLFVRVGEVAHRLIAGNVLGRERERQRLGIAVLPLHFGEIDAAGVDARRRAGFEAAQRKSERAQPLRERQACVHPIGAA